MENVKQINEAIKKALKDVKEHKFRGKVIKKSGIKALAIVGKYISIQFKEGTEFIMPFLSFEAFLHVAGARENPLVQFANGHLVFVNTWEDMIPILAQEIGAVKTKKEFDQLRKQLVSVGLDEYETIDLEITKKQKALK